jgi:hypothetical protein
LFIYRFASPPAEAFADSAIQSHLALTHILWHRMQRLTPEDSLVIDDARRWALIKGANP